MTLLPILLALTTAAELDVQGHRGCRGLMPENTLPAFEKALTLGVTTLELDIQVTRDGVLVVYHDPEIKSSRCSADSGLPGPAFREVEWSALAAVDCGNDSVPAARIPRVEQVLTLAAGADYPVQVSIEIKRNDPRPALDLDGIVRRLVDAVNDAGLAERTIVQSFDPEALRTIDEIAPQLRRSILVRKRRDYLRFVEDGTATIVSPKHGALREQDVRLLQERGVQVIPWTVNDPADMRRLIRWGVDGIITDRPDLLLEILQE